MKRRDFIVLTLVKLGFRTSLKGFEQFCMCVELTSDHPTATIASVYRKVALSTHCTVSAVEKNLRRLFESADASKALGALFGTNFLDTGNKEIVTAFSCYINLQHDRYAM